MFSQYQSPLGGFVLGFSWWRPPVGRPVADNSAWYIFHGGVKTWWARPTLRKMTSLLFSRSPNANVPETPYHRYGTTDVRNDTCLSSIPLLLFLRRSPLLLPVQGFEQLLCRFKIRSDYNRPLQMTSGSLFLTCGN